MRQHLSSLVAAVNAHEGSWKNAQLAQDVREFLWAKYDPEGDLRFPNIPQHWDKLLHKTIDDGSYEKLNNDEVLSILFGLHHRNRIIDGLWTSMFEQGVTQKLLTRLLTFDTK